MPRAAAALCIAHCSAAALGLGLKVEPKQEECFAVPVKRGQTVMFSFSVTAGGKRDIDASLRTLYDSTDTPQQEKSWSIASEGQHTWVAIREGEATACFGNKMSRWTPKWVSFELATGHDPAAARLEHLDPIEAAIRNITAHFDEMEVQQRRMRALERVHRDLVEQTNSQIMWWTVLEACLFFFVGAFQLRHLKRFLDARVSALPL